MVPVSGSGRARYEPIWAEDVAAAVMTALRTERPPRQRRFDLAGPETLTYEDIVRVTLRSRRRRRRLLNLPLPLVRRSLRALRFAGGPHVFATWDEAELMEEPMVAPRGTRDAESLGVRPKPMAAVLGAV